jgi:hypothetical protein
MRVLIACIGIAVLGCSASKAALVGLSTAAALESVTAAAEAAARAERDRDRERSCQQTPSCCNTKEYDGAQRTWRCTGCDR